MDIQNMLTLKARKAAGFTLIELIVTVVIVGIIFAAGIPGLNALLGNVSQSASADKLLNSLAYARGEAVARVENISVRALDSGVGWNVFIDTNADCLSAGDEILRTVDITADNVVLGAVIVDSGSGTACVGFNELGESRNDSVINLTLDSTSASVARVVVALSPSGYVSIN